MTIAHYNDNVPPIVVETQYDPEDMENIEEWEELPDIEDAEMEDYPDPDNPATPWLGIVHAQEITGLKDEEILQSIGWYQVEHDAWIPCLNCLWYGWETTEYEEDQPGDGHGKCNNCVCRDYLHDYDPQVVSDTWLREQERMLD